MRIALFGGAEERGSATEFGDLLGGDRCDLVGRCDLRQTMGALTHMKLIVGGDTGLMHVAAAVGCPTVTVFGAIPASKWGHHYEPHAVIQAPHNDLSMVDPQTIVEAAFSIRSCKH
jgi:ADP-heptose:LPS heptosyltransferase